MFQKNAAREKNTLDLLEKVKATMDYENARKSLVDPDAYNLILLPICRIREEFKEADMELPKETDITSLEALMAYPLQCTDAFQ